MAAPRMTAPEVAAARCDRPAAGHIRGDGVESLRRLCSQPWGVKPCVDDAHHFSLWRSLLRQDQSLYLRVRAEYLRRPGPLTSAVGFDCPDEGGGAEAC